MAHVSVTCNNSRINDHLLKIRRKLRRAYAETVAPVKKHKKKAAVTKQRPHEVDDEFIFSLFQPLTLILQWA